MNFNNDDYSIIREPLTGRSKGGWQSIDMHLINAYLSPSHWNCFWKCFRRPCSARKHTEETFWIQLDSVISFILSLVWICCVSISMIWYHLLELSLVHIWDCTMKSSLLVFIVACYKVKTTSSYKPVCDYSYCFAKPCLPGSHATPNSKSSHVLNRHQFTSFGFPYVP